ncbi:MAG: TonB-dependent receptor [Runella slithyformis]|nr:MAG: TonB-dependent receptor [Runella slithyformis]TAF24329.1 MAG: TonB-dependent receptor [Runella slithyformis]TAF43471.1 MAG: TonB-dependent receptor [Runella slithyformis]TAF81205.1 MAG: TonB-dependent receptor [Runella slithyformis]
MNFECPATQRGENKKTFLSLFLFSFTLFTLHFPLLSFAQKITFKGSVRDTANLPLEGATVMLMDPKDSSLVTFGRSQSGGNFELKNLDRQSYILKITFVGLRPYSQLIQPTDGDLGEIKMQAIAKDLNEVVIRGERSPVTIKADTIEYNADSFKVQPNSVVEDLLKRLPGVEVARDGTVKAQGQEIRRVTVDGKEFFGRDPKLATKNLPADAVDKVQVFDRKSDQAQFTGIDDGQREKSINLTLKEDKKKGAFGSVNAGAGPDNRYSTRASINRFSKTKQLSFLGMGNNVNQQGFSISDYMNFSGGMQRMMAGGGLRIQINAGEDSPIPLNVGGRNNGFVRSWGGGLNYNNQINKKTDLQSNYFFNDLSQVIDREVNQETFLPNGSFKTQQNTNQTTQNTTHRANITLDHKIDSLNSLKWTNNVSYASNVAQTGNSSRSFNQNGLLTNDGTRQSFSKGNNWRVNSELLWRHKFHKKGRTLSTNFTLGMDQNDRNGTLNAINGFYGANQQQLRTDTLRQTNTQANSRLNYGLTASFTEPLGKRKFLELNYALQQSRNDVNRQVFDVNQESRMPRFNALLSNQFRNNFTYQRGGLNFRLAEKLYNFSAGLSLQQSKLEGDLILQKTQINRTFVNLLPNARFKYDFGSSRNLNLTYDTDVREPSIQQLTPIVDNSDPLNIVLGNPNLRPEYSHRTNFNFHHFNQLSFSNFMVFADLVYTTNKIANGQQIDDKLVRTYQPVNVKDDYMVNANISKGFRIKSIGTRVNISTNLLLNRGITPINGVDNLTRRLESRNTLRLEYRYKEAIDLSASAAIAYNQTAYSLNSALNQSFVNQNYDVEGNFKLSKTVSLNTALDYSIYNFAASSFNQRVPLWNASISQFLLKNKRGELKLSVVDLLNKNVGISRSAQMNFLQDERIRSLGRYFLLSFTYNLKGLGRMPSGAVKIIRQN